MITANTRVVLFGKDKGYTFFYIVQTALDKYLLTSVDSRIEIMDDTDVLVNPVLVLSREQFLKKTEEWITDGVIHQDDLNRFLSQTTWVEPVKNEKTTDCSDIVGEYTIDKIPQAIDNLKQKIKDAEDDG